MTNSLLTHAAQGKLIGYWLIYLSIPVLYIALSKIPTRDSKTEQTKAAATVFQLLFIVGIVPAMMAFFSTRPSIYATKTSIILGLVGVYFFCWMISNTIYPEATNNAIDPNRNANSLALIHMIALGVVSFISFIYISTSGIAIVNRAKVGSSNYTKVNMA